jgi:opacity protein-like surface antigen
MVMMKKSFVFGLMMGMALPVTVAAQNYYDPGFYANQNSYAGNAYGQGYRRQTMQNQIRQNSPTSSSNYYAPHTMSTRPQREIRPFSIGADYVLGYGSYKTVDFQLDSSLTDGQTYNSDTRDLDRSFNSASFNLGWRPSRYFGIEAFYLRSFSDKQVSYIESYTDYPEFARGEYEVSYTAIGGDLLLFYPANDFIELLASIGVGKYDFEAKVKITAYEDNTHTSLRSNSKTFEDSILGYRIGGGFQIWLSKHIAFRATGRWTYLGGDYMNYITEVNAGIRYHF